MRARPTLHPALTRNRRERYWAAWRAYTEALNAAGVTRNGAALQSGITGTTVRMNGNVRQVEDGPYALESKENRRSPFVRSPVPFDSNPHEYGASPYAFG